MSTDRIEELVQRIEARIGEGGCGDAYAALGELRELARAGQSNARLREAATDLVERTRHDGNVIEKDGVPWFTQWCASLQRLRAALAAAPLDPQPAAVRVPEPVWPCNKCGKRMTAAEGGNVFTLCERCWAAANAAKPAPADEPAADADVELRTLLDAAVKVLPWLEPSAAPMFRVVKLLAERALRGRPQ